MSPIQDKRSAQRQDQGKSIVEDKTTTSKKETRQGKARQGKTSHARTRQEKCKAKDKNRGKDSC